LGTKLATGGFATTGEMDAVKVIAASNPGAMVLVIVEVPLAPSATEIELGEGESVNSGGGATTKLKVAVCVMPLPEPVTVIVYVPGAMLEGTSRVSVELPEPGAGKVMGLKVAVTLFGGTPGRPEADNVMAASNPPVRIGETVVLPLPPCCTVTVLGEISMLKFAAGPVVLERMSSRPTPLGLPQPVAKS